MKILCGTDFSRPAMNAADAAAALARLANETLVLAHVVDQPGTDARPQDPPSSRWTAERERLHQEAGRLRQAGASVQEELLTGAPDEALVEFARDSGVQLIVLASLGYRAASRWLLGSVGERTAQGSPVPTLVVRPSAPPLAEVFKQRKLKVLVGVDFTLASDTALELLRGLQRLVPCDIVAAYLSWPPGEHERLGLRGPVSLTKNLPEARTILERDVKERVGRITGLDDFRVRVDVGLGRNDIRLVEIAAAEDADLIVVGTHQRHGLDRVWQGSVSRGILHNAPMSVVCAPVQEAAPHVTGSSIPKVRRVLAATDFSMLGNLTIVHACSLPVPGGVVRLVHVVHPRALPGGKYEPGLASSREHVDHVRTCKQRLLALVPVEAAERGMEVEVEVVESDDTAKAICQAARRFGADIICMGSAGHTGLVDRLFGSVAVAVMQQTSRPLLVVRPPKP